MTSLFCSAEWTASIRGMSHGSLMSRVENGSRRLRKRDRLGRLLATVGYSMFVAASL